MTTNLEQLTPAQLRRVDALIADKVAGFIPCPAEYLYVPYYTADPAAALGLLSVLREKGYYLYTTMDPTGIWCGVQDPTFRYPVGYYQAKARTLPLAVVGAVLSAEGLELGEVLGE